ncbi:Mobile element protein [Microcystis aeruginosa NIES-98]|nr:Mobile element protein [Microcystis aeruginosa NIES-98]
MLERISLRGIARVTGVSWSWLQNYVNNKLAAVPRQIKVSDKPKGKLVIECDEMWSFVFSKTIKVYIWLAIDRNTSDCLDCQGVTQKTIKELLSNLKSQARKKRSKN